MPPVENFDILILGGGKGGKTLAMEQAKAGKRVGLVEVGLIGGSCINIACIPSKTLIRSASVAHAARDTDRFGTHVANVKVQMSEVRARTAGVVREMVETNRAAFINSGLELIIGWGEFVGPKTIEVATVDGKRTLSAPRICLDLGTDAALPPITGLKEANPMTHVEALEIEVLPARLLVIGGGFIGMELGQAFRRLGSEVAIIDRGPRLASQEDSDVGDALLKVLTDAGIEVASNADALSVSGQSGDSVSISAADGRVFHGSHLLVAAGRQPATAGIGLALAGIDVDAKGFIKVNDRLETSADNVWAVGEAAGTAMFTHASLDDYRVVSSALQGGTRTKKGRVIPHCVFIDPEFARVGMNEIEAKRAGIPYRTARLPMDVVPRARTLSRRDGFMKAIIAKESDEILGFAMLGENAGDVMSLVQVAMLGKLPFTSLRDAIFAHPTISEGLNMLFANVK